jgi:MSHA biogenesis protein MshL
MIMKSLVLFITMLLVGCATKQPDKIRPHAIQKELAEVQSNNELADTLKVPDAVVADLLPDIPETSIAGKQMLQQARFKISAENVEAKTFFASLVNDSAYSIVIHPDVNGTITLNIKDVTLDEIMELVEDIYGYDVIKSGNIYKVMPAGMRMETFAVNYLNLKRNGSSSTSISTGSVSQNSGGGGGGGNSNSPVSSSQNNSGGGQNGGQGGGGGQNGTQITTENETDFWKELEESLQIMIGKGDGRKVMVSPQAGLVMIKGLPNEIRAVKDYLEQAELILQRQVILEAKIVEVALNDQYQQGINWSKAFDNTADSTLGLSFDGNINANTISSGIGGLLSLVVSGNDFSGVIELLSTQGNVQVLSNPRLTASNNQKAVIKVGKDEYFVTNVSTTTVTGTATSTTPNISLSAFFSGIALDVTPQIDGEGNVILHIHPSVIDTEEQDKVINFNGTSYALPLAQSNIRESDTVIQAKSGEVVVIGGLMQSTITDQKSKVPLLGDLPFVGNLFSNTNEVEQKKELVILLKPTVVGKGTWQQQIQKTSDLLERWYPKED